MTKATGAPLCALCSHTHWAREPHVFGARVDNAVDNVDNAVDNAARKDRHKKTAKRAESVRKAMREYRARKKAK